MRLFLNARQGYTARYAIAFFTIDDRSALALKPKAHTGLGLTYSALQLFNGSSHRENAIDSKAQLDTPKLEDGAWFPQLSCIL